MRQEKDIEKIDNKISKLEDQIELDEAKLDTAKEMLSIIDEVAKSKISNRYSEMLSKIDEVAKSKISNRYSDLDIINRNTDLSLPQSRGLGTFANMEEIDKDPPFFNH